MDTQANFRFPPDSPYREQRLAFQQGNPEVRNEPPQVESPRDRVGKTLKTVGAALAGNPDVRDAAERKLYSFNANRAMKSAIDELCQNRTFAREIQGRKYFVTLTADNKLLVGYNTQDGRNFTAANAFDVGVPGGRLDQGSLQKRLAEVISNSDAFAENIPYTRPEEPIPYTRPQ